MTNELTNLARRAVACKGWRWMGGIQDVEGYRLIQVSLHDGAFFAVKDFKAKQYHYPKLPDLTDPATVGCLLMLVREVWKDRCACVLSIDYGPAGEKWVVRLTVNGRSLTERHWDTEIEALVAALEVAS